MPSIEPLFSLPFPFLVLMCSNALIPLLTFLPSQLIFFSDIPQKNKEFFYKLLLFWEFELFLFFSVMQIMSSSPPPLNVPPPTSSCPPLFLLSNFECVSILVQRFLSSCLCIVPSSPTQLPFNTSSAIHSEHWAPFWLLLRKTPSVKSSHFIFLHPFFPLCKWIDSSALFSLTDSFLTLIGNSLPLYVELLIPPADHFRHLFRLLDWTRF